MSAPLGASLRAGGVNFSVFSKHATRVELLLFPDENAAEPSRIVPLDAGRHRTYHYWHAFVPDLRPGQVYGYRAHGPYAPERGLRFDATKLLLDPYGRAVAMPDAYDRCAAARTGDNTGTVTGDLTLAGITKPVTLNVTFKGARNPPIPFQPYRIGFDATATIHRADFGLTHAIWSGMVGDDVTLLIEMEGELQ